MDDIQIVRLDLVIGGLTPQQTLTLMEVLIEFVESCGGLCAGGILPLKEEATNVQEN